MLVLDVSGVAFIYHSVCHLHISDDNVSCSIQMNCKTKSLALQADILAL